MATRFFPNYPANMITSRFGQRVHPILKIKTMHNGIDLVATNAGGFGHTDYITAHTAGTVEKVGYDLSAGNFINIRVDNKTLMVYYHMKNKSTLSKGAKVEKGDRLGYMGNTGSATAAHLHFGIQYDGKWVDPEPYLEKDWVQPFQMVSVQLPVLQYGANGKPVESLQQLLNAKLENRLDAPLDIDGSLGPKTLNALKLFQSVFGLDVDGSCGKITWETLLLK